MRDGFEHSDRSLKPCCSNIHVSKSHKFTDMHTVQTRALIGINKYVQAVLYVQGSHTTIRIMFVASFFVTRIIVLSHYPDICMVALNIQKQWPAVKIPPCPCAMLSHWINGERTRGRPKRTWVETNFVEEINFDITERKISIPIADPKNLQ